MNLVKKVSVLSSLFVLSLSACNQTQTIPLCKKSFAYNSISEVSVDDGLYGGPSGFVGANKDELGAKIKEGIAKGNGALTIGDSPITNLSYKGEKVNAYSVNESGSQYLFFVIKTGETNYKFVNQNSDHPLEYIDYIYTLGTFSESSTSTSGSTYISYVTKASFESVTYNADANSLTTSIKVTEVTTIDETVTTKNGTFNIVWKA